MSRPLRIQYEGAYYHVTCRGNNRQPIFMNDSDRETFLTTLERSADEYDVRILCYMLMDNHFHLIVRTLKPNLAEFMRHFNVSYTVVFNRRHRRSGHLYQGRYQAVVVEKDSYLLELSRYVHLNPIRTKAAATKTFVGKLSLLGKYPWSSCGGYVSAGRRQALVDYRDVLGLLGGDNAKGRQRYMKFVGEGIKEQAPNPLKKAVGNIILGSEGFVAKIRTRFLEKDQPARERPAMRAITRTCDPEKVLRSMARLLGISASELTRKRGMTIERGMFIEVLHRHCGLTQEEIGRALGGLDYSTVSVNRKKFLLSMAEDKRLRERFDRVSADLNRI